MRPPSKNIVMTNRIMKMLRPGMSRRDRAYPVVRVMETLTRVPTAV